MQEWSADTRGLLDNETASPRASRTNNFTTSNLSFPLIICVFPFSHEHQNPNRNVCSLIGLHTPGPGVPLLSH